MATSGNTRNTSSYLDYIKEIFYYHPVASFIFDSSKNLIFYNKKVDDLLGNWAFLDAYDIIEKGLVHFSEISFCLERALAGEPSHLPAFWVGPGDIHPDVPDHSMCFKISFIPAINPDTKEPLAIGILENITGMKNKNQQYAASRDQFLRLKSDINMLKQELESFVYSVSHDLKSPLISVEGLLSITLSDKGLDEDVRYKLERVKANTYKIGTMIDDLLEFSRIGRLDPEIKPVDLMLVARQTAVCKETVINEKKINVKFKGDSPIVSYPPERLQQVFSHLIDNAINYMGDNPHPEIEISIETRGDFARVSISDNGMGIDQKFHEEIFAPFRRLKEAKKVEGNGMGLCLARKIARHYGGDIWLKSTVGVGSTFYFTVPLKSSKIKTSNESVEVPD